MSAQEALDRLSPGARILLVLHKSHQGNAALREGSDVMQTVAGGRVELAVSAELSSVRRGPATLNRFFSDFSHLPIRVADPALHKHALLWVDWGGRRIPAHLRDDAPIPESPDLAWIGSMTQMQREAGATVLLTPIGRLGDADADASLESLLEWIRATRQIVGHDPMFVSATLPHSWLQDERLLDRLLEEFVNSSERYWWLRVRWPNVEPRFGQLQNSRILMGYRELAETAASEDKIVVLPNSALTGWVCTALGAGGYGTGTAWVEQAFAEERRIATRPGSPPPPRRNRYFERTLLHTIDVTPHTAIVDEPGYIHCGCQWCVQLDAGNPRIDPTRWDKEAAGYHYLYQIAELASSVAQARSRDRALREVRRGRVFLDSLDSAIGLTGEAVPRHLQLWEDVLAP